MIAAPDVDSFVGENWTGPDAYMLVGATGMAAVSNEVPNRLTRLRFIAPHHAILGGGVDQTIGDGRRRI